MKLLVIGRTGVIGGVIARHRESLGDEVIGLSRSDTIKADVSSMESLFKASERLETPDALVFCAGTHGWVAPVCSSLISHAVRAIEVNLIGALNCISVFNEARRMIFIGGGGAASPRANYAAYAASKAGLVRLVETVAVEQPDLSINVVAPGAVRSPMTAGYNDEARELLPNDRLIALIDRLLDGPPNVSGKFIHYLDPWETWTSAPEGLVLRRT